jgi:hypothetical protein
VPLLRREGRAPCPAFPLRATRPAAGRSSTFAFSVRLCVAIAATFALFGTTGLLDVRTIDDTIPTDATLDALAPSAT